MSAAFIKLPQVTLAFWIMKICATTLGETGGDLLSMTLNIGYGASSLVLLALFVIALSLQLYATIFHPFLYWMVILATSTAGTTISDYMDRTLALGYAQGALILGSVLVLILGLWRASSGTISVTTIHNRKQELFYWVAILVSNTLGTALGDFLADDSGLGFMGGAALVGSALLMLVMLYRFTPWSRITLFWLAFILTRPFGATIGDVLTKPIEKGGLNGGTIGSSLILALFLLFFIFYSQSKQELARKDV